jgi:hypothetical protein
LESRRDLALAQTSELYVVTLWTLQIGPQLSGLRLVVSPYPVAASGASALVNVGNFSGLCGGLAFPNMGTSWGRPAREVSLLRSSGTFRFGFRLWCFSSGSSHIGPFLRLSPQS